MLDLDYIKKNTLWVVKFQSGGRIVDTEDQIKQYYNDDNVKDIDTVDWKHQPKDLQEFWKAYDYANYTLNRRDLFYIDDFYREWSKNPKQFSQEFEHKPVIGKLTDKLDAFNDDTTNLIIYNYNNESAGNHKIMSFINAIKLQNYESDFDVIEVTTKYGYNCIIVQTDDEELFEQFATLANRAALHDRFNDYK